MCNKFAYHFDVAGKSSANQTSQLLYLLKWSSRSVKWRKTCEFLPAVLLWVVVLAATAQINKKRRYKTTVTRYSLSWSGWRARDPGQAFWHGIVRVQCVLETVNSEKYCLWAKLRLPQWWRPCPADVRAHLASFGLFSEKKSTFLKVLVSVFFFENLQ